LSTLNFQYQAFGFNLASDIPLPELIEKLLITNEQNSISVVSGNYENFPSIEASPQSTTKCSGIWVFRSVIGLAARWHQRLHLKATSMATTPSQHLHQSFFARPAEQVAAGI
jgi:hypothetical protein